MSKKRGNSKRGGRHTTLIDAARPLVAFVNGLPEVKRISFGRIEAGVRGGRQKIKIKDINGGLRIDVRGSTSIQELYVYSSEPKATKRKIEDFCLQ
jgi:hypothetical protein